MSSRDFTKAEKRKLRGLAEQAYARELDNALRDLDSGFSDWRHKHITGFQLSDLIHEFHQGASRELYSDYTRLDPGLLVGTSTRKASTPGGRGTGIVAGGSRVAHLLFPKFLSGTGRVGSMLPNKALQLTGPERAPFDIW